MNHLSFFMFWLWPDHVFTIHPCKGILGLQAHQWQVPQRPFGGGGIYVREASADEGPVIDPGACSHRADTSQVGIQWVSQLTLCLWRKFSTSMQSCLFQLVFMSWQSNIRLTILIGDCTLWPASPLDVIQGLTFYFFCHHQPVLNRCGIFPVWPYQNIPNVVI